MLPLVTHASRRLVGIRFCFRAAAARHALPSALPLLRRSLTAHAVLPTDAPPTAPTLATLSLCVDRTVAGFATGHSPTRDDIQRVLAVLKSVLQSLGTEAPTAPGEPPRVPLSKLMDVCRAIRPLLRDFAAFGVSIDPPMTQLLVSVHCRAGLVPSAGWLMRQLPLWQSRPDPAILAYFFHVCAVHDQDLEAMGVAGPFTRVCLRCG